MFSQKKNNNRIAEEEVQELDALLEEIRSNEELQKKLQRYDEEAKKYSNIPVVFF